MYAWLLWVCVHECGCPQTLEVLKSPEAEVTVLWVLGTNLGPSVDGVQTQPLKRLCLQSLALASPELGDRSALSCMQASKAHPVCSFLCAPTDVLLLGCSATFPAAFQNPPQSLQGLAHELFWKVTQLFVIHHHPRGSSG